MTPPMRNMAIATSCTGSWANGEQAAGDDCDQGLDEEGQTDTDPDEQRSEAGRHHEGRDERLVREFHEEDGASRGAPSWLSGRAPDTLVRRPPPHAPPRPCQPNVCVTRTLGDGARRQGRGKPGIPCGRVRDDGDRGGLLVLFVLPLSCSSSSWCSSARCGQAASLETARPIGSGDHACACALTSGQFLRHVAVARRLRHGGAGCPSAPRSSTTRDGLVLSSRSTPAGSRARTPRGRGRCRRHHLTPEEQQALAAARTGKRNA